MRWKRKQWPKEGDKRITKRFLLFPKVLGDEWRWLEKTEVIQQFQRYYTWWGLVGWDWVDVEWGEKS